MIPRSGANDNPVGWEELGVLILKLNAAIDRITELEAKYENHRHRQNEIVTAPPMEDQ